MKAFTVALLSILLITLQYSCAVSPIDCNATEPLAGKALDLINKERRNGYLFQLLRVADAHLDKVESIAVYYLVLDVKEAGCPVQSGKYWDDCEPAISRRPSDIVIGQCKVIATTCLSEFQDLRVNDFNCTTSSVFSALANTKDSPVLFDFFEDTELYRKEAEKALEKYKTENSHFASFRVDQVEKVARVRGGERTNYYLDFSVRNCSHHHFPGHHNVFGFCRLDLSYDVGTSDMETPEDIDINCEVFKLKEHRNISDVPPHLRPPLLHTGKFPLKNSGFRDYHHPHKTHKLGYPPPLEDTNHSDRPPLQAGAPPPWPPLRCHHFHSGTNRTHVHPHNHNSSEHHPHGHHPHGHHPHGHHPHGHPRNHNSSEHHPHGHHPHGHHPHGHPPHGHPHSHNSSEHHPHGHHPHGHHPHGHPPHGHPPHGHPPHGHPPHEHGPHRHHPHGHHPHGPHPHGHDFYDHGPCDLPPHSQGPQDHHHGGHGPPPRHSEERGPGRGHHPFHWRRIGYVNRLPPLKTGEVLPLPEANFPSFSLPNHNHPLKPEMQPFPQSASESCPGMFKREFLHVSKFFAITLPKENLSSWKKG